MAAGGRWCEDLPSLGQEVATVSLLVCWRYVIHSVSFAYPPLLL